MLKLISGIFVSYNFIAMKIYHILLALALPLGLSAQQFANTTKDTISNQQQTTTGFSTTSSNSFAMDQPQTTSPYEWKWVRDGIWTGAGLAGAAIGLKLIQDKDDLTEEEFQRDYVDNLQASIDKINGLDRWAAGNHSESASKMSDIPFAFSFAAPFALLFDDGINDHTGQFLGLYLETLATTATMYTLTAGLVNRSRPYVYDDSGNTSDDRRMQNNGQRSFYAGHVAASATATFFAAKVYNDYYPDSPAKTWMWAGAAAIPAGVAYLRIEAGQHFLTDVVLGYVLGAATGILVPELHKKKDSQMQIYPATGMSYTGDEYRAMVISYSF